MTVLRNTILGSLVVIVVAVVLTLALGLTPRQICDRAYPQDSAAAARCLLSELHRQYQ